MSDSNHKDFDSKKEALDFLNHHPLMSVGWPDGKEQKVAIYWNGKLHVEKATTKKMWGNMNNDRIAVIAVRVAKSLKAGRSSRSISVQQAIRIIKAKRLTVTSASVGNSFRMRDVLAKIKAAGPHGVSADLYDDGAVTFVFGDRFDNDFVEFTAD